MSKSEREATAARIAAELPEQQDALLETAAAAVNSYHSAVMSCDDDAAETAMDHYEAVVWKLNGGTFFACRADDEAAGCVVERHCAAPRGTVPLWGQSGEFLVIVSGIRAVVEIGYGYGHMHVSMQFHAVDLDAPFISETGFRSHFLSPVGGRTVEQAAVSVMSALLADQGRLAIAPDSRRFRKSLPARGWLSTMPTPAIEERHYQEHSGQIAFGF